MTEPTHTVYLGMGANIGNRKRTLREAVAAVGEEVGTVEAVSSFYESKPQGFDSPNDFLNIAVRVRTALSPRGVLTVTQKIERDLGRLRKSQNGVYQDRIIDIDILLYDDLTVNEDDLKIPHPLMRKRDFVMVPLGEIL